MKLTVHVHLFYCPSFLLYSNSEWTVAIEIFQHVPTRHMLKYLQLLDSDNMLVKVTVSTI